MDDRVRWDDAVRAMDAKINERCKLIGAERFWSAAPAGAFVAGELAFRAGLLPYNVEALMDWFMTDQLPYMRGEVGAELAATTPAALLAAFLNDKASQIVNVLPPTPGETTRYAQREPHGAIVAHNDMVTQTINVRKDAFRDWCNSRSKNALAAMRDLTRANIIVGMDQKITLGRGTPYASARSVCFTIDMTHPEIAAAGTPPKVVHLSQTQALAGAK